MRVIFINRYAMPDHSATSQMLTDLATELASGGYAVSVIASRQRYDDPDARLPAREILDGVDVHRVWSSRFGRHVLAGRAIDYLTFYLTATLSLFFLARRGDAVVVKTDPPLLSVPLGVVCRLKGARHINWLQDLYPEVAEALGVGRGRLAKVGYWLLKKVRNRSLKRAHMNVAIGQLMAERVRNLGVDQARITVVENWADTNFIRPVPPEQNRLRKEWGLADDFVVGYSGNLGRAHDARTFVEAMAKLEHRTGNPSSQGLRPIVWLFIGGGAQLGELKKEVERRGLKNVQFRHYQPRDLLAKSLSVPDLHLISLRPELEGLIVPSKVYGILAVDRPAIFLGSVRGEVARILESREAGWTVAPGDVDGLVQKIVAAADFTLLRTKRPKRVGLRHATENWKLVFARA